MCATPTGATPTGPTLDPLNILVNKFNIATHVALILFLFSSWINYLLYDIKSVMVFWQLLSKIKRFVTIFRISWNGPTLFNIPIGDFPPVYNESRYFSSIPYWLGDIWCWLHKVPIFISHNTKETISKLPTVRNSMGIKAMGVHVLQNLFKKAVNWNRGKGTCRKYYNMEILNAKMPRFLSFFPSQETTLGHM